jgi:hypothetical protein
MPVAEETTTWKAAVNPEESMTRFSRNVHALASGRSSASSVLNWFDGETENKLPLRF